MTQQCWESYLYLGLPERLMEKVGLYEHPLMLVRFLVF
jgi:hypothetical protein